MVELWFLGRVGRVRRVLPMQLLCWMVLVQSSQVASGATEGDEVDWTVP
jgi:hypothetical protein